MDSSHEVAIIGSGFGGLGMAIRLKQAGMHDLVVLEKADEIGGTWRDNTYPGAACDVPSHLYSFSFEPKPDWSRKFPPQPEILEYLRHCARKYGVMPHIRFGTEVTEARFDGEAGLWRISTTTGQLSARVLVAACGQLNRPALPDIPGRDSFGGIAFHSARWDHSADLDGKRVAVIGTGASAIQFVPELAKRVGRLHVFQRSAQYIIDKPDRPYTALEQALARHVPGWRQLQRALIYTLLEARALGFIKYPWLLAPAAWRFKKNLHAHIKDPALREALTPDYPMGCKRILLSNDYYPALAEPHVELITDPIERITADGIRTRDGIERKVDAIVYGTGFHANDFLAPMKIVGLDDRELNEAWQGGASAHLGITVSGFPNLFLLYGPYTNLGHNSIIYMLESQIRYVMGCLRAMRHARLRWIDVRPDVQSAFERRMQQAMRDTVWSRGCTSWYMTADGKVVNNWPGFTFAYRNATRRPDPRHFRVRR
ncbi:MULTISPECIES: flavin-containing monooxygenase [Thermomonospora]|uniref:FAD-dependent pyridine nucleotide-disulphide oxidoreductase n=1 Tax=Thermomonospora curvata (strain ATCC 19995 / DSM 43183 / JCM 3096 / KCTC 9072 / NBRC 15933 / NCIMB 10081 / Henssen B9) TaxID=471852 RepID=D1ACR8_THECD|nr:MULTISPECIES: NAD(P)/FAD-dependent oxidoreductase [Thermomonospora]ACY97407.1 FAD-dependent pyridine nucleotide-disulphide oxidoreductase [Thermomonospora curvata DSM 43183]PKK14761.1 MAG: NAD(P)/FAD-dependent oxidoreductase [Thermomonospora sp. CIF 1]